MRAPVMAKPTRKGQLRFHSLLKNTGHGSNFLILLFFDSLFYVQPILSYSQSRPALGYLSDVLVVVGFCSLALWASVHEREV
ncbi:hypothetical protein D5086_015859 [Populus alba]|uniref:Uncharacterized protein n=1 Tax=Populus alba TaxID=43335 RepID=A0ACC4BTQ8_POPAL